MSKIYEVRSIARNDGKVHGWGSRHSCAEAQVLLAERTKDSAWAERYHQRWWIEEIDTTGLFQIPPKSPPRARFSTQAREIQTREGTWNTLHVDVLDQTGRKVADYSRNYPTLYRTFEPFRQGDREFALISVDYTATSVLDLSTGKVIAAEPPASMGFCPVGFYVPDWWDINDGSVLPGSMSWRPDHELPKGDFGFVWGCVWGDDSSWKVQFLDLSRIQQGEIRRDARFGYIELAADPKLDVKDFIDCSFWDGKASVRFYIEASFDLQSGEKRDCDEV